MNSGTTMPQFIRSFGRDPGVDRIAISPDGRFIVGLGAGPKPIGIWDIESGRFLREVGLSLPKPDDLPGFYGIAFAPEGNLLGAATDLERAWLVSWDAETGRQLHALPLNLKIQDFSFALSARTNSFAVKLTEGPVQIRDRSTGGLLQTLRKPPPFVEPEMAFSPDGMLLAVADYGRPLGVWDTRTGVRRWHQGTRALEVRPPVAFSGTGTQVASGAIGGIELLTAADGKRIHLLVPPVNGSAKPGTFRANAVAFSADDGLVAGAGQRWRPYPDSSTGELHLWDTKTGKLLWTLMNKRFEATGRVKCVAFSPDGRWLVEVCDYQTIGVWRLR